MQLASSQPGVPLVLSATVRLASVWLWNLGLASALQVCSHMLLPDTSLMKQTDGCSCVCVKRTGYEEAPGSLLQEMRNCVFSFILVLHLLGVRGTSLEEQFLLIAQLTRQDRGGMKPGLHGSGRGWSSVPQLRQALASSSSMASFLSLQIFISIYSF